MTAALAKQIHQQAPDDGPPVPKMVALQAGLDESGAVRGQPAGRELDAARAAAAVGRGEELPPLEAEGRAAPPLLLRKTDQPPQRHRAADRR